MSILLTHEPVVNKSRAITANRLVVHGSSMEDTCDGLNEIATAWPMERTVLLSLEGFPLDATLAEWELPGNTLIELPASFLATAEGTELAHKLTRRGTGLCVTNAGHGEHLPADIPFRFGLVDANAPHEALKGIGVTLATGLHNVSEFEKALADGFAGATGWFFLHEKPTSKKTAMSATNILRVLNLVRHGADVREIEEIIKHDVTLSFRLLRYVNSAAFGLQVEIQSFRHAVTMLGYDKLNKWLSVLLVTASKAPGAQAMMQASVTRGRFMEMLGQSFFEKAEWDNLFITGAFSLLDVLLGTEMGALLNNMHLPEPVIAALSKNEGAYAPFLNIARACESDPAAFARQTQEFGIAPEVVNRAELIALSYADTLQSI
jgi:EAL and modified HD-GYP domain-containing signal transduction protein